MDPRGTEEAGNGKVLRDYMAGSHSFGRGRQAGWT